MSLLQDVLRSSTSNPEAPPGSPKKTAPISRLEDDSDDEYINVESVPGTPARTRPSSRSNSPTRRAARPLPGPLHLGQKSRDPLKAFPTDVSQKIFGSLNVSDLAKCAGVSKKWLRSQSINYVWFQHYRRENFRDESLPVGKWTKRESKQNWRTVYGQSSSRESPPSGYTPLPGSRARSGYASPSLSGYQTPREMKEEAWRAEEVASAKPGKVEMRSLYKEMAGRKSKSKNKGSAPGDRVGWAFGADQGEGW